MFISFCVFFEEDSYHFIVNMVGKIYIVAGKENLMRNKNWKKLLWSLASAFAFVNILFLNVFLHELGHYAAAGQYGLEPEVEFEFENMTREGFKFGGVPVAYTSFNRSENNNEIVAVALAGPFANILLGIAFMFLFVFLRKRLYWKELALIGVITSIGSGLMNLLPFYGSDGALVWNLL